MTPTYRTVTLSEALTYVWYAGMSGVGAWFLFTNLRFARALRKARTPYRVEGCRYPVYLVSALPSPCLFGVLRPAVYLNEKALQSPDALRFVLAHEQTHARHLDPLWSLLRGVCLTVYWFDPLVWLAAVLSREDGELACDEGTLRALGADERREGAGCLLACHEIRFPAALVAEAAVRVLIGQQRVEHAVAVLHEAAVVRVKAQRVERKEHLRAALGVLTSPGGEAAVRVLHGAQAHERAVDCGPDAALLPILRQRL